MSADHCVCCGKIIPEGRQVCRWCGDNVTIEGDNKPIEEMTKGELTSAFNHLAVEFAKARSIMIEFEKELDQWSDKFLSLCERNGVH